MEYRQDSHVEEVEYIYHWHRIIPAIIGLILVIWGLTSSLWPGDGDAPAEEPAAAAHAAPAQDNTTTVALPEQPAASAAAPTQSQAQAIASAHAPAPAAATSPSAAPAPARPAADVRTPVPSAKFRQGQILRPGKMASAASLSQVLDQEPLPIERGAITVGKKKAVKIVFSAKLPAGSDSAHFFWFLDGKLQAHVNGSVSPEGETRASKYVSHDAPGQWQVVLTNAQGKVLAEGAFLAKAR